MGNAQSGGKKEEKKKKGLAKVFGGDKKKKKQPNQEVKLLLLGAGESGKSTFAKQLKIMYMHGFTNEELSHYKGVLNSNIMVGMSTLIEQARLMNFPINPAYEEKTKIFADPNIENIALTPTIAGDIKQLWPEPAIQSAYARRSEFQLHGSVPYIVNNIDRLAKPDAQLVHNDVLQCRVRTTGIDEIVFDLEGITFKVIDVGGQRSERRKWIHCFDNVTAVIFCVALNEYDEKLVEDNRINRMAEALDLFAEISNNGTFKNTPIILFLNKSDLFQEKIGRVDLSKSFPEYTGGADFDNGTKFITDKFIEKSQNPQRQIFPHVTCATDTTNVRDVFDSVRTNILSIAKANVTV